MTPRPATDLAGRRCCRRTVRPLTQRGDRARRLRASASTASPRPVRPTIVAAARAEHGEPKARPFVAGAQTAGRGRLGRTLVLAARSRDSTSRRRPRRRCVAPLAHAGRRRRGRRRHPRGDGAAGRDQMAERHRRVGGRGFAAAEASPASSPKRRGPPTACSTSSLGSGSTCGRRRFRRSWRIARELDRGGARPAGRCAARSCEDARGA